MERQLEIIAYLLARIVADREDIDLQTIMEVIDKRFPKPKRITPEGAPIDQAAIDRIYAIYPTKCPISNRPLGKSAKDKEKIARMLTKMPEDKLAETIKRYITETTAAGSYFKNFATLLNNIPDYEPEPEAQPTDLFQEGEKQSGVVTISELRAWYKRSSESEDEWQVRLPYIIASKQSDGITVINDEE